jgi:hypothetical protein
MSWRVGKTVLLNVYDGGRPVCQCHYADDAERIVDAVNLVRWLGDVAPETLRTWRENYERTAEKAV